MSAPFTPGPWLVGAGSGGGATTYVYENDGNGLNAIAACTLDFVSRPFAEREANARLIAAAPELYAELYKCVDHSCTCDECNRLRAVLARARGEQ